MKKLLLLPFLFITVLSFAQVPAYVPATGLVAWYPFNGSANDESGNGHNGTVNGSSLTTDRFGNNNAAYNFDGVDDFIEVAHSSDFDLNTFTVSAWINASSFGDGSAGGVLGQRVILSKREASGWGSSFEFKVSQNSPTQNCLGASHTAGSNISFGACDEPLMNQAVWYHVLYTQNTDSASLFIDGAFINSIPSGDIGTNNLNINIGKRGNGFHPFDGSLDDIGIWNRVLDSNEINDLFLAISCTPNSITSQPTDQTTTIGNNATISFTDNLTGAIYQWQMDAGTGYSDLSNAGQFSGSDTDSLIISTTTMVNHNTLYRCIVTESASCMDTTDVSTLTVIANTSIGELNNSLVKLFPNPSNDIITLTLAQHSNGQIILTDILGKEVLSKSFSFNEAQLNLKSLESKGTYFAKVLDSNGNVIAIKKLIYQ